MRTLTLLLALVVVPFPARAQEPDAKEGTTISTAQVSGMDIDRLSPGLRQDINALAGTPLDWGNVWELAARIEGERPGVAAAVRALPTPEGTARVVFLVARIEDDPGLEQNINARYTIERAEVTGAPEPGVSPALSSDIQALAGARVDQKTLEQLAERLRGELPGYEVHRRMSRGTRRGQLQLVFDVRKGEALRWLHFAPSRSKFLFHSEQGWGGLVDIRIGSDDWRVTPMFAIDNRDDLLEEYSGVGARIESRHIGSERLGASFELSWYEQTWQDETLAALALNPGIPEAYRSRSTFAPSLAFAVTPRLWAGGGVSITELESLSRSPASQMANAFVLSAGYDQQWERTAWTQRVEGTYELRTGTESLQSDLAYTRHQGRGRYTYTRGRNEVLVSALAGRITSDRDQAPLFERFTLGDSSTLRGWNKYDIAPAGGDRVFHTSLEYRHRGLAFFFDTGSVWDRDADARIRTAAGFGFHPDKDVFLTLGFPLNTDSLSAIFMAGVRF
jgi:hypothetical protein